MDEIRELPCPQCGAPQRRYVEDVYPGAVFHCDACPCFLMVTGELTLRRATNDDLWRLPIGEQDVARAMQRAVLGMDRDVHC